MYTTTSRMIKNYNDPGIPCNQYSDSGYNCHLLCNGVQDRELHRKDIIETKMSTTIGDILSVNFLKDNNKQTWI